MSRNTSRKLSTLIDQWHTDDASLWAANEREYDVALSDFCAATDAIVLHCDRTGKLDFASVIAGYKEAILADHREGKRYPSFVHAKRALADGTLRKRGPALGALDRLAALDASAPAHGAGRVMSKKAKAFALLKDHPDWMVKRIAQEAGCNPKYLSQCADFRAARAVIKANGKADMRRSPKHRGHDMDAYEDT
jgi:hypothetical protein